MKDLTDFILYPFRYWKRYLLTIVSTGCLIFILLFPLSDLGDLLTTKVSEMTGGAVYLQPQGLEIGLYPSVGVKATEVIANVPVIHQVEANAITISPNIAALLRGKLGAAAYIEGIYGGDAKISFYQKSTDQTGVTMIQTDIRLEDNSLDRLMASLPMELPVVRGNIKNLEVDGVLDPTLREQPNLKIDFQFAPLNMQEGNVQTAFGPFPLPAITVKSVRFNGSIARRSLNITRFEIGQGTDEINATVLGKMDMDFRQSGVIPGAYDFNVNLNISKVFEDKFGLFLSFIKDYRRPTPNGASYAFRISAPNMQVPPQMQSL